VQGILLALESEAAVGHAVNLGTGRPTTVRQVADVISAGMGLEIEPILNQQYRAGDIRHCFADPKQARELLGFAARTSFEDGMAELIEWLKGQEAEDKVDDATRELAARGLAR
jgi:dTDP-L-rhamnose 4-epimerase